MPFFALLCLLVPPSRGGTDWIDDFLAGSRALERGDLPEAIADFERTQAVLPGHAASAYALACAHALAGEREAAFAWLERAREFGFADRELLAWDPDLESLREDPRFRSVSATIEEHEPEREAIAADLVWQSGGFGLSTSANGSVVATGRGSPALLYDLRAGELVGSLLRLGGLCAWLALDPRGRWVAVTSERDGPRGKDEHGLQIFDAATGDLLREPGDPGWMAQLQVDARGTRLMSRAGTADRIEIYDTSTWERIGSIRTRSDSARLSPDGARVMLVLRRGMNHVDVAFWDVERGTIAARYDDFATLPGNDFGFAPDSARAFLLDSPALAVHVFDARSVEPTRLSLARKPIWAGFLGGSEELGVLDDSGRFEVLAISAGEALRSFRLPLDLPLVFEASRDGRYLIAGKAYEPRAVIDARGGGVLWSLEGGVEEACFAPEGDVVALRFGGGAIELRRSEGGELLARVGPLGMETEVALDRAAPRAWLGADDGSLRELDLETGRARTSLRPSGARILAVDASADGRGISTLDAGGVLRVFDVESSRLELALAVFDPAELDRFSWPPPSLAMARGRILVQTPKRVLRLVDVRQAAVVGGVEPSSSSIASWCWAPDGGTFALEHEEGIVRIHSGEGARAIGPELAIVGKAMAMAFEPSGARLWVGSDRSKVHVFDVATGATVRVLDLSDLDTFDTVELGEIAFRDDGELAITTSSGFGVVAAWDPRDGARRWAFDYEGGNESPLFASFGASGERVYVCGQGYWSPRVVDATNGATLLDLGARGLGSIEPVVGERRILASGERGLECLDRASGRRLWSRVELANDGWLLRAESGYVDGSRDALERLHLAFDERSYPLDALAASLLDPKKVRASAAGVRIATARWPSLPTLEWVERPARVIELGPDESELAIALEAGSERGLAGFELTLDGERSFVEGRSVDARTRRLELELPRPAPGVAAEYRWRAVASDGLTSRALRLTLLGR